MVIDKKDAENLRKRSKSGKKNKQTKPNKQNKPNRQNKQSKQNKQRKTSSKRQTVKPEKASKPEKTNKPEKAKQPAPSVSKKPIKISFLGGLDEIGKNITLYEYQNEMIIVDCGLAFPDSDMPGVDLVIPDFTYVERNRDKIKGIFITHGHEDHIGSLPYLLKSVNIPIYGTRLALGLIECKLKEHGLLGKVKLNVIKPGDTITLGQFSVEAIHVNHSIPDAVSFAIRTPAGTIVQTGDFKIDTTPIDGDIIDLARFAEIGKEGVLALLSDSTNAERPGYTESERKVGASFENLFRSAGNRRIIVATFASNIHRVQQIIDVAASLGRKVAVSGRSLENLVTIGIRLEYLNVPEGILIPIDRINGYTSEQLVIITTGSQGEPMSALYRMAFSDHKMVEIGPTDYVIISATPIPGNEKTVGRVVNELMKRGANVIYEKMYDVHVSGHARQEELKTMIGLVKPKFFIPVHGEYKHLVKHSQLALAMGISKKNIIIPGIGDTIEIKKDKITATPNSVPAGKIFVDGSGVGDVGSIVIRDRKHLAQDGLIIVVATIDGSTGEILAGPDIVSRGFVYVRESEQLMEDARELCADVLYDCARHGVHDWASLKTSLRDEVSKMMYNRTKRSPMVLPIIMDI